MDVVVQAERMAAGGDALAREPSGRIVFAAGALPGELVRVAVTSEKRDYIRGDVVEVLEPSDDRIEPPCPQVRRGCGGCGWQHATLAAQARMKVDIVRDALRRTAHLPEALVEPGPALPAERFRTSLRMAVDRAGSLGYRRARSHDVVAVDDCLVAHPLLAEMIRDVRLPGATEAVLRCGARTGERLIAWSSDGGRRAARRGRRDGPPPSHRVRAEGIPADVATGWSASVVEIVAGRPLRSSARSFFQSSPEAADLLVAEVRRAAATALGTTDRPVVDAYGGVGLFAVCVVPDDIAVVHVEASPDACADARHNLAGRRATVVEARVERWSPVPAGLVVADPAREGLGRDGVAVLAATSCDVLVLVSCDPVSLARDAALLAARGLEHRSSVVVDPFPHTPHIEVITRFERRGAGS